MNKLAKLPTLLQSVLNIKCQYMCKIKYLMLAFICVHVVNNFNELRG